MELRDYPRGLIADPYGDNHYEKSILEQLDEYITTYGSNGWRHELVPTIGNM